MDVAVETEKEPCIQVSALSKYTSTLNRGFLFIPPFSTEYPLEEGLKQPQYICALTKSKFLRRATAAGSKQINGCQPPFFHQRSLPTSMLRSKRRATFQTPNDAKRRMTPTYLLLQNNYPHSRPLRSHHQQPCAAKSPFSRPASPS